MRLIGDAAARVVADGPGVKPGFQSTGQISGRAIVAGDDDRRRTGITVEQSSEQVGPQRLRDECATAVAGQRGGLRIFIGVEEKAAEHPL